MATYDVTFELPNKKKYNPIKSRNIEVSCKSQDGIENIVKNMFDKKVKILKIVKQ